MTRDYGGRIEADDFESIDGPGTTRLTRDFSGLPYSRHSTVDSDDFRESFPIRRNEFAVVVGQIAPLARTTISRDEIVE